MIRIDTGPQKKTLKLCAVALALVLAGAVHAAEEGSIGTGVGVTSDSCPLWLEARKNSSGGAERVRRLVVIAWSSGYLSGKNSESGTAGKHPGVKGFKMPSSAMLEAVLDAECAKEPLAPIFIHLDRLADRLRVLQPF